MVRARTSVRKLRSLKLNVERLEDRLIPTVVLGGFDPRMAGAYLRVARAGEDPALPSQNGLFVVPGTRGAPVTLNFEWTGGDSRFANEVGVFVVDGPRGRVHGVLPGHPAYARRAIASPRHTVLFAHGRQIGASKQFTFTGGQRLGFYLIRGGTSEQFLATNPRNALKRAPVALLSIASANPDGRSHLRSRPRDGGFKFGWEDSTSPLWVFGRREASDFNDIVMRVSVRPQETQPPSTGGLLGPASAPANAHIPDLAIPDPPAGDLAVDDRPNGTGLETSRTRIMVQFTDTATVGAVNALLQSINAHIIGTVADIGLVLIGIPDTGNFTGLDGALATLQGHPAVALAVQDVALEPLSLPKPTTAQDAFGNAWMWSNPPSDLAGGLDGNWGLEAVRAPQMWNLNDFGHRREEHPRTVVLDEGFNDVNSDGTNDHPQGDVSGLRTWWDGLLGFGPGAIVNSHGQHVAGIIGAGFTDDVGVAGINPFAERHAPPEPFDSHFIGVSGHMNSVASLIEDLRRTLARWDVAVMNISLGYGLPTRNAAGILINPNASASHQSVARSDGLLIRQLMARYPDTIIVAAAGNTSLARNGFSTEVDAQWTSPWNWAALGANTGNTPQSANILVVESVDGLVSGRSLPSFNWQYTKSDFSDVGGHVSAPGGRILSTVGANTPYDDDGDGRFDEDPANPNDDDGDGLFDEDPISTLGIDDDGDGDFDEDPITSIDEDSDGRLDEDPVDSDYITMSGTSMAAPHVTGLIGYLLTLDPDLTVAQIRTLLTHPQYTRATQLLAGDFYPASIVNQTPAPMFDAFAAAMGIDLVTNDAGKSIQRALVDVDDGTADGNLRVDPLTGQAVAAVFAAYQPRGDGHVTMRDFRAWRDAYLQIQSADFLAAGLNVALDGGNHVKKDLNRNGVVATDDDYVYPRYDFNGDGSVLDWWALAPFKIDPETPAPNSAPGDEILQNTSTDLQSAPGFLRDIDVLADPVLWSDQEADDYSEGVSVFPFAEGTPNLLSPWQDTRYLLANRDPDSASDFLKDLPDYIHSFDVHVSVDWTALDYGHDAILLRIDSEMAGPSFAERFRREAIIPAGTADFVVTIPVWTGNVQVRVAGFDRDAGTLPDLELGEPREDWTGGHRVSIGEDKALKLEARDYTITNFNDMLAPYGVTYSFAAAINNLGDVVLETNYPGTDATHLFLVERGGNITHLNPLIGGSELGASAINDSRQIAGTRYDEDFEIASGFIYQYGETPSLTELGARHKPLDINEAGDVVGYIYDPDAENRGFLWHHEDGTTELLGDRATGINNLGHVVGILDARVFLYRGAGLIDIGLPPGQTAGSLRDPKINDSGQIAGVFHPPQQPHQPDLHAPFIWEDGIWTFPFLSPFGQISYFGGLFYDVSFNESGVGVGNTGFMVLDPDGSYYAWRFDVNGGARLSNLDPPDSPFSKIDYVGDINDRGDIVGYGILPEHRHGGFVLTRVL